MADYVPKRDTDQYVWLQNLRTNLPRHVAEIDITPARLAQVNDWIDAHLAAHDLVRKKRDEWLAASSQKKLIARQSLAGLRKEIARWKTAATDSSAAIAGLQLSASVPAVDANHHQPELEARGHLGQVRLRFKKRGATDVNLYVRREGETAWRLVARVSRSPYVDPTPVAVPGAAETREYQAIGVVQDREIGQPSDTVIVTVPGTVVRQ